MNTSNDHKQVGKLKSLNGKISKQEKELNPSLQNIVDKENLKKEKIFKLIKNGEDKYTEFKETFGYNKNFEEKSDHN